MALTKGGKLVATVVLAAVLAGGGFYASKHKSVAHVTAPVAVESVQPAPTIQETPETVVAAPVTSQPVVKHVVPVKKHKVVKAEKKHKSVVSHSAAAVGETPSHHNADDAALKAIAGSDHM